VLRTNPAIHHTPHVPKTREGLWGKTSTGRITTVDQAKIAENSMIHAMRGMNGEVAMIEDIGKIADLPELTLIPSAIFPRETPTIILKNVFPLLKPSVTK
jgi:hypothetical protein